MNIHAVRKRHAPIDEGPKQLKIPRLEEINPDWNKFEFNEIQHKQPNDAVLVVIKAFGKPITTMKVPISVYNVQHVSHGSIIPRKNERVMDKDTLHSLFIGQFSAREYFDSRKFYRIWSSNLLAKSSIDFLRSYKLISKIGEGGYGQVYHARRIRDDQLVAIKLFNESSLNEKAHASLKWTNPQLKKVPTELNAMIELEDVPGIVQLHEAYYSSAMDYLLVMETSEHATNLKQYIKERGRLSEEEACHYFKQIVESLELMYLKKRHHFDLKSSNILIDRCSAKTTLIDFGGAQRVLKKNFTNWVGTTQNFPPEYFSDKKFYGIPVESWSLGLMLLQMTTGHLPVSSDQKENFRRSYDIPTLLSSDLRNLISQCLSRNPRCRPNFKKILASSWIRTFADVPFHRSMEYRAPISVSYNYSYDCESYESES